MGDMMTSNVAASVRNRAGVLHRPPSWLGWCLMLGFAATIPALLVAQDRNVPTILNEQMRGSTFLRAVAPIGTFRRVVRQELPPALADTSRYNWKAGWIGLGVGAAVGVAFGAWAPGEEGEGVYAPYMVGGALLFGILGFFVGLAIGNN